MAEGAALLLCCSNKSFSLEISSVNVETLDLRSLFSLLRLAIDSGII